MDGEAEAFHEEEIKRNRIRATLSENVVFLIDTHEEMLEAWNDEIKCRMDAAKEGRSVLLHIFYSGSYAIFFM